MTFDLINTCGGAAGVAVTIANSDAAGDPWDKIGAGLNGTLIYDETGRGGVHLNTGPQNWTAATAEIIYGVPSLSGGAAGSATLKTLFSDAPVSPESITLWLKYTPTAAAAGHFFGKTNIGAPSGVTVKMYTGTPTTLTASTTGTPEPVTWTAGTTYYFEMTATAPVPGNGDVQGALVLWGPGGGNATTGELYAPYAPGTAANAGGQAYHGEAYLGWTVPSTSVINGRMEVLLPTGATTAVVGRSNGEYWSNPSNYPITAGMSLGFIGNVELRIGKAHAGIGGAGEGGGELQVMVPGIGAQNIIDGGGPAPDTWTRIEWEIDATPGLSSIKFFAYDEEDALLGSYAGQFGNVAYEVPITDVKIGNANDHVSNYKALEMWVRNVHVSTSALPPPPEPEWNDIPGATSGTLTFIAEMPDDQNLYRAKWSSIRGDVLTREALLTVIPVTPPIVEEPDPEDTELPDAIAPAEGPGCSSVLDVIRAFSLAIRRPVRLVGSATVEMVNTGTPLPSGITQADAADMYWTSTRTSLAGIRRMNLKPTGLAMSASATLVTNDVRVLASSWRIPHRLPVYGVQPALVMRVSYTFTPDSFEGSIDFAFPVPSNIARRT